MMAVVLSLLLPWLAGYAIVRWAWPLPPTPWRTLFRASLAAPLALGLSSLTYFLWCVWVGPRQPGLFAAESLIFGVLAIAFWRAGGVSPLLLNNRGLTPPARLRVAFLLVLLCAVAVSVWYLGHSPHGNWDAWAIWNLRARFLYRGEETWTAGFSPLIPWSHPDYPLLVPASVARGWTFAGGETSRVPQGIACLFGVATVGVLMAVLALLRGPCQGYLGGLVLLSTPYFLDLMTAQYADVPLGFFFLASAMLFEIHDREDAGGLSLPFLAGALTGLAAWTKNEGSLFLVATVLVRLRGFLRRPKRAGLRELIVFALGMLPAGLVLVFFKLRFAPANDLVAGQDWQATRERLLDFSRYVLIAEYFLLALVRLGPGAVIVLFAYRILLGRPPRRSDRQSSPHAATLLVLMLAGYALVYLTTPNDLAWHLHDSIDRLFMQLWPTALLAFFLATATPEEARQPQDRSANIP